MKSEEYIKNVLKTASGDYEAIGKRLDNRSTIDLLHAAMGMVTESTELLDMLKKHIFYGKDLDFVNAEEELGDSNWYQSLAIQAMRVKGHFTSWESVWDKNVKKLRSRYGDKFTEEDALNRDLDRERNILEGK